MPLALLTLTRTRFQRRVQSAASRSHYHHCAQVLPISPSVTKTYLMAGFVEKVCRISRIL